MKYYFDKNFEFDRDFFSTTPIEFDSREVVHQACSKWLEENCPEFDRDFYLYLEKRVLSQIDPEYQVGIFYYHWLNEFLREVSYLVWRASYDAGQKTRKREKDLYRDADRARETFLKFAKENFK